MLRTRVPNRVQKWTPKKSRTCHISVSILGAFFNSFCDLWASLEALVCRGRPRQAQDRPRQVQNSPRQAQESCKTAQNRAKTDPRQPKIAPRQALPGGLSTSSSSSSSWPWELGGRPERFPRGSKRVSRELQEGSWKAYMTPKRVIEKSYP